MELIGQHNYFTSTTHKFRKELYIVPGGKRSFLFLFKKWSWIAIVCTSIFQCIFFADTANMFGIFCILIGWRLTLDFILQDNIIKKFPLSSFLIFGFSFTQYLLPPAFTLIEGKPLTFNLIYPYQVFYHSLLALGTLIVSQRIYIYWIKKRPSIRFSLQKRLYNGRFFETPSSNQMWVMGIIGLSAMFITFFFIKQDYSMTSEGGTNAKIVQGLVPFSYAPYFVLLKKLYSKEKQTKISILKYIVFTTTLFLIAIGGNSRGLFMTVITEMGIGYFFGLLLGKFNHRTLNIKIVVAAPFLLWFILGPLSDVGTAMLIVRSERGKVSKYEMLSKTLNAYQNKQNLEQYRASLDDKTSDWNEHYFDNIFLARFCNLKFNDASLEQANKIGHTDPLMRKYSIDKFWSNLPQPFLDILNIKINKRELTGASFGDYLFLRAGQESSVLGGYRTGQFAGTGMASFGWWYLLLLGIGIIPVFFLLDLFSLFTQNIQQKKGSLIISLGGLLPITSTFMFLSLSATSESIVNLYSYTLRGWLQTVALYWFIFFISKKITSSRQ